MALRLPGEPFPRDMCADCGGTGYSPEALADPEARLCAFERVMASAD